MKGRIRKGDHHGNVHNRHDQTDGVVVSQAGGAQNVLDPVAHGADQEAKGHAVAQAAALEQKPILVAQQVAVLLTEAHGLLGVLHGLAFCLNALQISAVALLGQQSAGPEPAGAEWHRP